MADFVRPRIMGIINCTPDSFYAGSRSMGLSPIVKIAETMIAQGVDILDVGGESTRPGSIGITAEEQMHRVIPAIRAIRSLSPIDISIDTRSAKVAEAALNAGATMINDISALRSDPRMAELAAEWDIAIILMHMQKNPIYGDVVLEVKEFLLEAAELALARGIAHRHIMLDPGIGFGKNPKDNLCLLKHLFELRTMGYPILVGLSRKSFLSAVLNQDNQHGDRRMSSRERQSPEDRLMGTMAAHAWCLTQGVDILRVHDVQETSDVVAVWEAIECAS